MTNDDEEKMIHNQILSARMEVERLRKEAQELQLKRNRADKYLADAEQAAIDYMIGSGIIESDCFFLKKTEVVDIAPNALIPEEFTRSKIEPDKRKIANLRPIGNWYTIKQNVHIQLRSA